MGHRQFAGWVGIACVLAVVAVDQLGRNLKDDPHAVGLKTGAMNYHVAEQLKPNWCWAACIQMVLSTRGLAVSQQDVVKKAFGDLVDESTGVETIAANLNKWIIHRGDRIVRLNATVGIGPPPDEVLIKCLSTEIPVIVGLWMSKTEVGHAVVITAVVYQDTPEGPRVRSVMVRDPAPSYRSQQGKRKLTAEQIKNIQTYFHVTELGASGS